MVFRRGARYDSCKQLTCRTGMATCESAALTRNTGTPDCVFLRFILQNMALTILTGLITLLLVETLVGVESRRWSLRECSFRPTTPELGPAFADEGALEVGGVAIRALGRFSGTVVVTVRDGPGCGRGAERAT